MKRGCMMNDKLGLMKDRKFREFGKRSVLFSLMTLFLLVPVFIVSNMHLESTIKQNSHANKYIYAERIKYIENDIATDIMDILNYSIVVGRYDDKNSVEFRNLLMNEQASKMQNYEDFVFGKYGPNINTEIELNLSSEIYINDLIVNITNETLVVDDLSDVQNMTLHIKGLDAAGINETSNPLGGGSGSVVTVVIENYYGVVVMNESIILDLNENNNIFEAELDGSIVKVNVSNKRLEIWSNISLRIESMEFVYNDERPLKVSTGNFSIASYLGIEKNSRLLLVEG